MSNQPSPSKVGDPFKRECEDCGENQHVFDSDDGHVWSCVGCGKTDPVENAWEESSNYATASDENVGGDE